MGNMLSAYGEKLNTEQPLREYPRPQMVRDSYLNLNGLWQYAITGDDDRPEEWTGEIVVPFSPESLLSGVGHTLMPGETLWYRRGFLLPQEFVKDRVLLHFGAVDQRCTVYLNGWSVGAGRGGYLPFCFDITDFLVEGEQALEVMVHDDTDGSHLSHGRQKLEHGGVWHAPQSGIWQTVWMESVPGRYIKDVQLVPQFDDCAVDITVEAGGGALEGTARVLAQGEAVAEAAFSAGQPLHIEIPDAICWHPDAPFLYALQLEAGEDSVQCYFGLRKFGVEPDADGRGRLMLNGEPYFVAGVLDQGMTSDGLYTPPSDEAMLEDIRFAKDCGFNMIRKHGKLEPLRWYYHCDRLGMLVWQDLPAAGHDIFLSESERLSRQLFSSDGTLADSAYGRFGRDNPEGREHYLQQMAQTVRVLGNAPSLMAWVLFQSGQGQFDAADAADRMRALDPHRLIDHASGRYDQGAGDILSLHTYNLGSVALPQTPDARAAVITECGGFGYTMPGHFGGVIPHAVKLLYTKEQLAEAIASLYQQQLMPLAGKGVCGFIYAQLSDAGDEVSGLLTADRREAKIHARGMATLNTLLMETATPAGAAETAAPEAAEGGHPQD